MTSRRSTVVAACLALGAAAAPAGAEHNSAPVPERGATVEAPATEGSLDIGLKIDRHGFRFGSRVFGRNGYAGGAWLNGETRRDGFSIDGRIERGGKAHDFKLNAEIDAWLQHALRWWGATDL